MHIYINLVNIIRVLNQFPQQFVNGISSNLGMTKPIRVNIVFHRSATLHQNQSI